MIGLKETRMTVLSVLIRRHRWKRGAELGVWQGATFGYLLGAFQDLELFGVDTFEATGPYFGKDMAGAEAIVRKIAEGAGSRAIVLKMSTVKAAALVGDGTLDFVFIDASHDTASVLADIAAWRSKIRSGGALIGHDANWPTVRAALNEAVPGWKTLGGNVWIFPFT